MLKPKDPGRWSHLKLAHLSDAILTNNALYQGDDSRATVLLRHWEHLEVREVFLTGDFGVLFITIYLKNKTYQNHRWILFEGKLQRNGNQVGDPTSCFPEKWNTAFGQCSLAARDDNEDYEKVPLHEILREEGSALSSRVPRIPWFSGKQTLNCENINFCDRQDSLRMIIIFLLWGYPTSPGHDKVCWDAAWKHLVLSGSKIHDDQPY
jgi:hypothetical protein